MRLEVTKAECVYHTPPPRQCQWEAGQLVPRRPLQCLLSSAQCLLLAPATLPPLKELEDLRGARGPWTLPHASTAALAEASTAENVLEMPTLCGWTSAEGEASENLDPG